MMKYMLVMVFCRKKCFSFIFISCSSGSVHLEQLIKMKEKHFFLQKTMTNIYFIMLSSGICLYMAQYSRTWAGGITAYVLTLLWIAFNYFYTRPRSIKKQQAEFSEIIKKLQDIKDQMIVEGQ